jgi:ribosomal protein S18 acetylase RimI-like enzyme
LIRQVIREAGPSPVTLQVLKTNPRARKLYERLGFHVTGRSGTHDFMRRDPDPIE